MRNCSLREMPSLASFFSHQTSNESDTGCGDQKAIGATGSDASTFSGSSRFATMTSGESSISTMSSLDGNLSDASDSDGTEKTHQTHAKKSWISRVSKRMTRVSSYSRELSVSSRGTFPMYVGKMSDVINMASIEAHQTLVSSGKVQQYRPGMRVLFVSHQWTSWEHPDKAAEQFSVLQEMLCGLRAGDTKRWCCPHAFLWRHNLNPLIKDGDLENLVEEGYIWYDYFCIPQPSVASLSEMVMTTSNLSKAVDSIPFYTEHCEHFCMLTPFVMHSDSKRYLGMSSYVDRGWCRAEMAAWALNAQAGTPGFWGLAPGLCVESGAIHWLLYPPNKGDFAVESDRKRVDLLISRMLHGRMAQLREEGQLNSFRLLKAISGYYTLDAPTRLSELDDWLKAFAFESEREWSGGWQVIHFAALEGNAEILENLVALAGVSVDKRTSKGQDLVASHPGMTACHICAFYLPTQLAIKNLKVLAKLGANLNKKDVFGHTTLHYASKQSKRQHLIQYLVDVGCPLEATTVLGDTPLSLACQFGYSETATFLIQCGARVQFSNIQGMSPLMLSCMCAGPNLIQLLLDSKADANHTARPYMAGATWMVGKALLKVRSNSVMTHLIEGGSGRTPLMIAAMSGNAGATEELLQAGADPKATNCKGENALCHAKKYSRNARVLQMLSNRSVQDHKPVSFDI
eukprot:TRINITY_DN2373_c0_g1_i2.p1 TRINITY_DN2373_c0_g1~~TRINITY_DN2373_c0_g1_i2.p1  ORF type:complete len:686 (-),score=59.63 TRINITY_DN2373_c0_g1_i2:468-2525(-)